MSTEPVNPAGVVEALRQRRKSVHFDDNHYQEYDRAAQAGEDPNETYFQQENAEYIEYWNTEVSPAQFTRLQAQDRQTNEWDSLQDDWDSFEATASGIRSIARYQFQPHNPYLLGNSTRSRNHSMHMEGVPQSFYEVTHLCFDPNLPH